MATKSRSRESDRPIEACSSSAIYHRLLSLVRRRLRGEDAEDVVQDAYVRLTSAVRRGEVRNAEAFLHTTTLNLVRDRYRAAAVRRAVTTDADAEPACSAPDAERVLSAQQQLEILERALAELPLKRRTALVLYRFEGKSHAAIAETLGLSVSMVEKHVRAALAHCRLRLAEANGDA